MEPPTLVTESGHRIWDPWAVELETGELLYALVRAAKPRLVVESGTGNGYATEFMARALLENGQDGLVVTFETDTDFRERSTAKLAGLPVEFREGTGEETDLRPDLVFVDCFGGIREPVIRFWLTHPDRPLTVIHDARRNYPFHLGDGVFIPGHDGVWIGRAKEN